MNLLLDYDGTLHDSTVVYAPAFRKAYAYLVTRGFAESREWSDEEISRWTGYNAGDMWAEFMPELSDAERGRCSAMILNEELRLISDGAARLYPGAEEVLRELTGDGHTLVLLSNCGQAYLDAHVQKFGLDAYFTACYCGEAFGYLPKHVSFHTIRQNHPGDFIVIGDRFHDMQVAQTHMLRGIGCAYGCGESEELSGAEIVVNCVRDIPAAVRELSRENT